ncbi:MAG: (Fe-S)-binding protein [Planctomycetes bacterium]|nr:(Fe-S)-binding protein [Planctomycetota bacterium]
MRVSIFVTCLVDQIRPEVGVAAVRVLRRAGCEVTFHAAQTCCGQPAWNAGYVDEARSVARALMAIYAAEKADAIVVPSGSCTAMIRHLPELFESPEEQSLASSIAERTHEFVTFLVRRLGLLDLGACWTGKATWHDACHGLRDLGISDEPRSLMARVRGLELVEAKRAQTCCGFGGTFSIKHPELSVAMADEKLDEIESLGVRAIVSGDVSCLMHLGGRLARRGSKVQALHIAELLAAQE